MSSVLGGYRFKRRPMQDRPKSLAANWQAIRTTGGAAAVLPRRDGPNALQTLPRAVDCGVRKRSEDGSRRRYASCRAGARADCARGARACADARARARWPHELDRALADELSRALLGQWSGIYRPNCRTAADVPIMRRAREPRLRPAAGDTIAENALTRDGHGNRRALRLVLGNVPDVLAVAAPVEVRHGAPAGVGEPLHVWRLAVGTTGVRHRSPPFTE